MADSNFIDYVKIFCRSGNGGPGSTHMRREKYVPKGGPDGGDGGRGGHIILRANPQFWTLIHLKYRKHIMAEHGASGSGQLQTGKNGEDIYLDVPLGTVAKNAETGEVLFEMVEPYEERSSSKEAAEALETIISRLLPTRHRDIHSPESLVRKDGSYSSLNFLQM